MFVFFRLPGVTLLWRMKGGGCRKGEKNPNLMLEEGPLAVKHLFQNWDFKGFVWGFFCCFGGVFYFVCLFCFFVF